MKRFLLTFFIFVLLGAAWKVQPVSAGTDIAVSCDLTTCTATPNSIPLFNESNIWPGFTVTQQITATNTTVQNGELGMLATELIQEVDSTLASKIYIEIHRGSASGPVVYGGGSTTLQDFYAAGQIDLGLIGPSQSDLYFLKATFDPQAGNEYMGTNTTFNLDVGFVFTPVPSNPQVLGLSSSSNGGGGGGGGGSTGGPAQCGDPAPGSAPVLLSAVRSGNQVTLNWTAVAGADHYAINFGIQPGVYLYGNNNVGNVTTYVVGGLSPGTRYFFQILGINGCAPGPRSNEISTTGTLLPPGSQVGAPTGFSAQQVLGVTTESTPEATPSTGGEGSKPEVLGATTCDPWRPYLPLIFLVIQFILSVVVYVMKRNPENRVKQGIVIGVAVICTILFYILRNCDCDQPTFLSMLCKWYFVVALLVGLLTQFINYSLIEREE